MLKFILVFISFNINNDSTDTLRFYKKLIWIWVYSRITMCFNYIANCTLGNNTTQFLQRFAFNQEKNYILGKCCGCATRWKNVGC